MPDTTQVKEITSRLEQGVKDLFNSDSFAEYLKTMSRFHKYSTRNTVLIHMQRPDATLVAGYRSWETKFGRHVKRGEKAIKILAPVPFTKREEKEKLDPVTNQPILGEDGLPVVEYTERQLARFKVTHVFDAKQTDGKPLPTLVQDLTGNVEQYEAFMDALRAVSPLPIVFEPMPENTDGVCYYGDRIAIREGMSEVQTVCAIIHEITHAKLHDIESLRLMDETVEPKDSRTEEVEAEAVSYAVCQYFGIETGENSFGYLAEWSKSRELKELNASLDTIRKTAADLIDVIDDKFQEIAKERDIAFVVGEEQLMLSEFPPTEQDAPTVVIDMSEATPISRLMAEYEQMAKTESTREVGANVLMTPVFDDMNFNRTGKKIRVAVEEPAGKYRLFSREEGGDNTLYFQTASGMIDRTSGYFRDVWNEETRKHESYRPTETELDELLPQIAERFEKDMADPTKWAMYQHAAVLNRIDECEAHNVPVRELRNAESQQRRIEAEQERALEQQRKQEKFDARVDEIATVIKNNGVISVEYNEYEFDGKNPVLELFKLYNITLPLRTQGWVNTGLAEINDGSYRYFKSKHRGNSTTFGGYLKKLREAIKLTPIEQKRKPDENSQLVNEKDTLEENSVVESEHVANKSKEQKLYEKFAELFPQFAEGEYSYMKLEAGEAMMPLSLEYLFGDRISVMHTYKLNGDLCYDPMMEFRFDNIGKTMSASMYEQSIPPRYQYFDDNNKGVSVDGNGNSRPSPNLQSQLNDFASQWLENISHQGYVPVKGHLVLGENNEVEVTFDEYGNPIMPELEKSEDFHLGCGPNDNGVVVWNWNETTDSDGNEKYIAHISIGNREITYLENNLPDSVKADIEAIAQGDWKEMFKTEMAGIWNEETVNKFAAKDEHVNPTEKVAELDLSLPDGGITTVAMMNDFGYTSEGMLPMFNGRAVELFDTGHPIYLLYPDGTEALAYDRDEVRLHDGYCGIERDDWECSPVYAAQISVAQNTKGRLEADLLYGDGDKFGIYQIPSGIDEARDFRFVSMDELEARGIKISRANYNLVYAAPLTFVANETQTILNNIYSDFNTSERPTDYAGRSVSVSDIIVLKHNGNISSHYVDSVGFVELDSFLGEERQQVSAAELPIQSHQSDKTDSYSQVGNKSEEYTDPSVAELEADVKAGKSISLTDLSKAVNAERKDNPNRSGTPKGKPTLMARLEEGKRKASQHGQSDTQKNKEARA